MDGLLIVDKPSGPTSHDVVARVRRALCERRIGHTGTLDPMASGVLPLVVGRATRLARFLSGDKTYDATIRLGFDTDTYDAMGRAVGGTVSGPWPAWTEVDAALRRFRGTFLQQPPAFSAKKIDGRRSYALARRAGAEPLDPAGAEEAARTMPAPVSVRTYAVDVLDVAADLVRLRVRCSAGFYIRSLAHDLGAELGTGAHLSELRRTAAAGARIERAIPLEAIHAEGGLEVALAALIPMEQMLDALPSVLLTDQGVARVRFGRDLGPADAVSGFAAASAAAHGEPPVQVRLLDPAGRLVAVAEAASAPGLLHPAVVLL